MMDRLPIFINFEIFGFAEMSRSATRAVNAVNKSYDRSDLEWRSKIRLDVTSTSQKVTINSHSCANADTSNDHLITSSLSSFHAVDRFLSQQSRTPIITRCWLRHVCNSERWRSLRLKHNQPLPYFASIIRDRASPCG